MHVPYFPFSSKKTLFKMVTFKEELVILEI